jgi:hypothetical protein
MARYWKEIRKVIKTASGAFLAYKFGISPILQDFMSINRYLPRMKEDIRRHVEGDKHRYSVEAVMNVVAPPDELFSSSTAKFTRKSQLISQPTVRYVLVVKPANKYTTPFFRAADALVSRFVTSPASLAWELVPFSFVVDWFVDLRGTLGLLDKLMGFSPYEIVSFTRSHSYHCAVQCYLETLSPCNGSSLQSFRQCSVEYKHYDRSIVGGGSLPTFNPRFGKNQAAVSAALIAQRLSLLR